MWIISQLKKKKISNDLFPTLKKKDERKRKGRNEVNLPAVIQES